MMEHNVCLDEELSTMLNTLSLTIFICSSEMTSIFLPTITFYFENMTACLDSYSNKLNVII